MRRSLRPLIRPLIRLLAATALAWLAMLDPAAAQGALPYGASSTAQLPPPPPLVLPPAAKPPKLEHLPKVRAQGVLGQAVLDAKGEALGHVVNVLIDAAGRPRAAVVEFAGFLGVGDRKIAMAWDVLHFSVVGGQIVITVTLDAAKLKALPEYKSEATSVPVAVAKTGNATAPAKPEPVAPAVPKASP